MKRGFGSSQPYTSLAASSSGSLSAKVLSSASIATSDSISSGSVGNLKLAAEKLVKEQAVAIKDLEMTNAKLKKLMEQVQALEKIQSAFNENAKFKVKQKEDEKLFKGLESEFELSKTVCNQLCGTLQQLTAQVQDGEKDKAFLEVKLSAISVALDKSLSLMLKSSEETAASEKELLELGLAKERIEMYYKDEHMKAVHLIEKEGTIKQLKETVAGEKMALEGLALKMEELHLGMRVREEELSETSSSKEILEKENMDLNSSKLCLSNSKIYASLEKVCLEGTHAQSKSAVLEIAALAETPGNYISPQLCQDMDSLSTTCINTNVQMDSESVEIHCHVAYVGMECVRRALRLRCCSCHEYIVDTRLETRNSWRMRIRGGIRDPWFYAPEGSVSNIAPAAVPDDMEWILMSCQRCDTILGRKFSSLHGRMGGALLLMNKVCVASPSSIPYYISLRPNVPRQQIQQGNVYICRFCEKELAPEDSRLMYAYGSVKFDRRRVYMEHMYLQGEDTDQSDISCICQTTVGYDCEEGFHITMSMLLFRTGDQLLDPVTMQPFIA